jgi:hypothetical protein
MVCDTSCVLSAIVLDKNAYIPAGIVINAGSVEVKDSVRLTNNGTLNVTGSFSVDPGIQFAIQNKGTIVAAFDLPPGAELLHYISSSSEMTRLSFTGDGKYTPILKDFTGVLNAKELIDFGTPVLVMTNKPLNINVNQSDLPELEKMLKISGNPILYLVVDNYDEATYKRPDFGTAVTDIQFKGADNEYLTEDNGGPRNYEIILGEDNPKAKFLANLRAANPENRVLAYLDGAQSNPELLSRMEKVMFFNPLVLNDALVLRMTRVEFADYADMGFYSGARMDVDAESHALRFDFGFSGSDFAARADIRLGRMNLDDNYKYGSADFIGVGAAANYKAFGFGAKAIDANWHNILFLDGVAAVTGAKSRLFYVFSELAPKFDYIRPVTIQPVVRLNYVDSRIANHKTDDLFASFGGRIYFSDKMYGMENRYGVYAISGNGTVDYGISFESHIKGDGLAFGVRLSPSNLSVETRVAF